MSATAIRIVAIGGGGCTNGIDPALDRWIIGLLPRGGRRAGYIGAASKDDAGKSAGFARAYSDETQLVPPLPCSADAAACASWLEGLDLVYVGGGNTQLLLDTMRRLGWSEPLTAAARRGTILAGVSAGAMCWFDEGFSDSGGEGYRPLQGLGLVRGSCCPHYSEELARKPAFEDAIAAGAVSPGVAIDDGVAVLCDGDGPVGCFSARPGHGAYRLTRAGGAANVQPVPSVG